MRHTNDSGVGSVSVSLAMGRSPTFTVQGNVCHRIGSLLPLRDGDEQFMQLYFLDADQADEHRATLCGGLERYVLNY